MLEVSNEPIFFLSGDCIQLELTLKLLETPELDSEAQLRRLEVIIRSTNHLLSRKSRYFPENHTL